MPTSMRTIFFYGLFMDRSLLTAKGLQPEDRRAAELRNYRFHIGERATLVPAPGRRVFGVVMGLQPQEVDALYADPSVREYRRERVQVELLASHELLKADCYVLPRDQSLQARRHPGSRCGVCARDRGVRRVVLEGRLRPPGLSCGRGSRKAEAGAAGAQ